MTAISKPPLMVAHEVLACIQAQGIVSADDHVKQEELACSVGNPISRYNRFGESYIRYLRHTIQMERIQGAVRQIADENPSRFSPEAFDIAVTRLKIANCGPLAMLAAIEASKDCTVLTVGFREVGNSHRFVILDPTIDLKSFRLRKGNTLAEVFAKCPKGVVLDPFFKEIDLVSEASQMRLVKYMKICGLERVTEVEAIPRGFSAIPQIFEQVDQVYQRLRQKDLNAFPSANTSILDTFLKTHIAPHSSHALQQWFPNAAWKRAVDLGILSLSMDGTDETTKPVSDQLKALGMGVKRTKKQSRTIQRKQPKSATKLC
jgi:hypothetical protein